jgi:hypothetical protein
MTNNRTAIVTGLKQAPRDMLCTHCSFVQDGWLAAPAKVGKFQSYQGINALDGLTAGRFPFVPQNRSLGRSSHAF